MPSPALNEESFRSLPMAEAGSKTMTLNGTMLVSTFLIALVLASGAVTWNMILATGAFNPWIVYGSAIVGFLLSLVIIFKKTTAPFLSPVYALVEGVFLGAVSLQYESLLNGIVLQAILLTIAVALFMGALYTMRIIKVTRKLAIGIVAATGAVCLLYLVTLALRLFGIDMPFIHDSGPIGIGFSLIVVGIAAFNLLLDYDLIEQGCNSNAPKYMEWYASFGLLVTIIWLYLEILRLLSKLRR